MVKEEKNLLPSLGPNPGSPDSILPLSLSPVVTGVHHRALTQRNLFAGLKGRRK
jgi:hypothetical protein